MAGEESVFGGDGSPLGQTFRVFLVFPIDRDPIETMIQEYLHDGIVGAAMIDGVFINEVCKAMNNQG